MAMIDVPVIEGRAVALNDAYFITSNAPRIQLGAEGESSEGSFDVSCRYSNEPDQIAQLARNCAFDCERCKFKQ